MIQRLLLFCYIQTQRMESVNSTHQFQKLRIYNFQGAKLMEVYKTKTLDLSRLPAGILYFNYGRP